MQAKPPNVYVLELLIDDRNILGVFTERELAENFAVDNGHFDVEITCFPLLSQEFIDE